MTKVFVSGSMKIKNLDDKVIDRLNNIVASKYSVIVGDADGVDSSIQEYLKQHGVSTVTVYCSGAKPRNNIGHWKIKSIFTTSQPGTRAYFTAKDKEMAADCDYGFMVWDARSTGTLSNAIELVERKKIALVYVNKAKQFLKIKDVQDLEKLLGFMSEVSLKKADDKIGLLRKIEGMKFSQDDLFVAERSAPAYARAPAPRRQRRG